MAAYVSAATVEHGECLGACPQGGSRATFKAVLCETRGVIDTHATHIRVKTLKSFLEQQKRAAEEERIEAIEDELGSTVAKTSGEISAYEEVLQYLEKRTAGSDRSLIVLRTADE